jgi:hypothetical protein
VSEKWGACRSCNGQACAMCGWTGFGGGIEDLEDPLKIKRNKPTNKAHISHEEMINIAVKSINKRKIKK